MNGAQDSGRGVLILVLGILSLLLCQLLGPIPWLLAASDLKKIAAGEISAEAKPLTQAGMVCGIIATVLFILGFVVLVFWVVLMGFAGFVASQQ